MFPPTPHGFNPSLLDFSNTHSHHDVMDTLLTKRDVNYKPFCSH